MRKYSSSERASIYDNNVYISTLQFEILSQQEKVNYSRG